MRLLLLVLPFVFALGLPFLAAEAPHSSSPVQQAEPLEKAQQALEAGDLEKARSHGLTALAIDPYRPEAHRLMFDLCGLEDKAEEQLIWGKRLYWMFHYGKESRKNKKAAEALAKTLDAQWPGWNQEQAILDRWRKAVEKAISRVSGGSNKQYRVAGKLMENLLGLYGHDKKLQKEYDKLFKKAGEALSGGAFVNAKVRRHSARWIEDQNRKHQAWEGAFKRRTAHYEIITNISYEFFETVCGVMEDMHDFYREVYQYKGSSPTMTLAIHRNRTDFDRYCQRVLGVATLPTSVGGWFWDVKMTLAAYDRTEKGEDLSDLWRVLFHEASHQFMYLLCEKRTGVDPPTWLNEGTASYFEGCELKSDGTIIKNKPAMNRIREWEHLERGNRRHTLMELITCPHRKYDGSFYSYGWAFVYFLNNYENENGELIYRQPYLNYLYSYTSKKDKRNAFERAEAMFVQEVADPEVTSWQALENRWRKYTQEVAREAKAGPEFAEVLQQRAESYLERGDYLRAFIAAEQAEFKRTGDPKTYELMAYALAGKGDAAEAIYWMFRVWEIAWYNGDLAKVEEAESWMEENGGEDLVKGYCQLSRQTLEELETLMDQALADGKAAAAALTAAHGMRAFGMDRGVLLDRIQGVQEENGLDLRLWQRAYRQGPEENVKFGGIDVVKFEHDGVLINNPVEYTGPRQRCRERGLERLSPPFEFRCTVQIDGRQGAWFFLGIQPNGRSQSALSLYNGARVRLNVFQEEQDEDSDRVRWEPEAVKSLMLDPKQKFPLYVFLGEKPGQGLVKIGDKDELKLPEEWTPEKLSGEFAVGTGDDTVALFTDLEIRSKLPFWPVLPPEQK
ncbi:MAG: DUF1570 domain-containing protein [Planctomycetota bacterium]|nr:MAG: DUF1570 domain-containing protein [Planctomycetota bacterium]